MGNIYVGDCSYAEIEGAILGVNPWGMDTLTRFIEGRVDHLSTYLATLKRSRLTEDNIYKGMWLHDYSIEEGRVFAKATLQFAGVYTDAIPEPVFTPGNRVQSVTLPFAFLDQSSGVSATFDYIAPFTTVEYAVKAKPLLPKYRGYVQCAPDSLQIVSRSGAAGALSIFRGKHLNSQTASQITSSLSTQENCYNAVAESFTPSFEPKQLAGPWWVVREQNEVRLIPLDLYNSGFTAQIPGF